MIPTRYYIKENKEMKYMSMENDGVVLVLCKEKVGRWCVVVN